MKELLLITWYDIISDPTWLSQKDARKQTPVKVTSVGWYHSQGKVNGFPYLSINACQMYDTDQTVGSVLSIPIGCLESVEVLRESS